MPSTIPAPSAAPTAPREAPPASLAVATASCANCDAPLAGPFCAACGQGASPGRLTMRDLAGRLVGAFDIDRGLLGTTAQLFRRPGAVIRDYLGGRTLPFTNPVKHFALAVSLVQLVALATGATGDFVGGLTESSGASASRVAEVLDRWFVLLAAPAVLVLAAVQRRVFRRTALHYAEHLVFALYVCAQQLLLWVVVLPATTWPKPWSTLAALAVTIVAMLYHAWAAHGTFGEGQGASSVWGTAWRALVALALTGIVYFCALALVLGLLVA
jgi:hypothetical protein